MQADRVTYIGHATTLIEVGGTRVLTDPVLRPRVGHIRRIAAPVTQDLEADAILLSHAHHDHLYLPSLKRVRRIAGSETLVRVLLRCAQRVGVDQLDRGGNDPLVQQRRHRIDRLATALE